MSRKVATLIYDRRSGSAARKSVLAYFADRADDYGRGIFASKQTIADETELGRSTVIRIVNDLVAEGILIVAGSYPCRNGATVVYDMDLQKIRSLPAIKSYANQSQSGTSIEVDQSQSGTLPVPERDPKGSQSGTQTVLEPSINIEEVSSLSQTADDEIAKALSFYQSVAARNGWSMVEKMTAARKSSLKARLRDAGGLDGWKTQILRAEQSDFICGKVPGRNGQPFKCSFDFLAQQQSFIKLMEGTYDNRQSPRPSRSTAQSDALRQQLAFAGRARSPSSSDCF